MDHAAAGSSRSRRRGLAVLVPAPAGDAAVGLHAARVRSTCADRGEGSGRRCGLAIVRIDSGVVSSFAPAGKGAVALQPTREKRTRIDRNEGRGRWRGLALGLVAPTDDRPVGHQATRVPATRADRGKSPWGREALAAVCVETIHASSPPAPAGDRSVAPNRARGHRFVAVTTVAAKNTLNPTA
jgi:hypothetical protein